MKPKSTLHAFFLAAGSSLLAVTYAPAGQIWDGGGVDTNWTTAANWDSNTLPNFANAITFSGTTQATNINDLTADTTIGGINFTNTTAGQAFSISGNRITLGGNITTTASSGGGITDIVSLAMILNGNRTITTNTLHNLTLSGIISEDVAGRTLTKSGAGTLTLSAANSYTGTTTISAGTLTVSGASGSINASSGITLGGGRLFLDSSTDNNADRIANNVTLSGGELSLSGNAAGTSESFNTLGIAGGNSTVTVKAVTVASTLAGSAFSRTANGTALIRGTSLGQGSGSLGRITLTSTAGLSFVGASTLDNALSSDTTKDVKIVPYLIGGTTDTDVGSTFVTYDTTLGFRALDTTNQFNTTVTAATNVRLASAQTGITSNSINSLIIANAGSSTINNTNTLTVTSGAVLFSSAGTIASASGTGDLGFGTAEGVITTAADGTISARITGSGGLTKSGNGTLSLTTATNTFTGEVKVNAGRLIVNDNVRLGNTANNIVVSSGGQLALINATVNTGTRAMSISGNGTDDLGTFFGALRLDNGSTIGGTVTLAADSRIGGASFGSASTNTLTGKITGAFGVDFFGATTSSNANAIVTHIISNTGNDYTGNTTISNGAYNSSALTSRTNLRLGASNVIPNGSSAGNVVFALSGTNNASTVALDLNGFSETINGLTVNAGTFTSRIINGSTTVSSTLTVGDNNTTSAFSGIIEDSNATFNLGITKIGSGTLTLSNGSNTYRGVTTVNGGELRSGANNALGAGNLTVNSGGTLNMQNFTDTVGTITLNRGTINLGGSASLVTGSGGFITTGGTVNSWPGITLGGNFVYNADSGNETTANIASVNLNNGSRTFTIADGVQTIDVNITTSLYANSGNSSFIKAGAGTMQISSFDATNDNYGLGNGTTTIQDGVLLLNKSGSVNAVGGTGLVTIGDGTGSASTAVLRYTSAGASNQIVNNPITILSDGLFDLNGKSETTSGALTHSSGGSITTGAGTLTLSNATNTISGASTVTGNLTYSGTAATNLTIGNTANINGTTTFSGGAGGGITSTGTPTIQGTLALGTSNRSIAVSSGTLAVSAQMTGSTGTMTKSGAGILTLSSATSTYSGTLTVQAGTLVAGANAPSALAGAFGNTNTAIVLGNASTAAGDAPSLLINGAFTVGRAITVGSVANTAAYNATIGGSNTSDTSIFSGNITLNTTAANYTATLQAATGGTTQFSTGTWTTNNKAIAIGSSGNTGTVRLNNAISTSGGINLNFGTLELNSAFSSGNMTVASGTTLSGTGSVAGTTGVTSGTVNGTGLTLTGLTTFNSTGNTLSGTVTSTAGVSLAGSAALANSATVTGGIAVGAGTLTGTGGSFSAASTLNGGTINLTSGSFGDTLGVTGGSWNGSGTVSGVISSTSGTFTIGSGANLTATSGVTATGGAVVINGTLTGDLNANFSTTISGTGSITGNAIIAGIHNPGNSPGIQPYAANLTYSGGLSVVNWELAANAVTNAPVVFDQITVGGNLDFTDLTTLNLIFNELGSATLWGNSLWDTDQSWTLYDVTGTTTGFGNLSLTTTNWADSGGILFDAARPDGSFSLSQSGQDILINYTVIPEPSTALLCSLGLLALLRRRRN